MLRHQPRQVGGRAERAALHLGQAERRVVGGDDDVGVADQADAAADAEAVDRGEPAVMLALWPSWPVAIASAAIMGLGFGVYLSVDQALVTQVLPSAAARAKDLGIINIANSGPQVLAPAIAAPLVARSAGTPPCFLSVAVITVLGSAFVWKIRSIP